MKRISLIGFAFFVIFTAIAGCGQSQTTASASWPFDLINWHHRIYRVTSQTVTSIGRQVTSVTTYSTNENVSQTGTFSNFFPVGTKIFSIPGIDVSKAIAIKTSQGACIEAILDHSY